ncbi:MAG: hypothetical protein QXX09_05575 [Candidatus Methanomethylicia archaeon]
MNEEREDIEKLLRERLIFYKLREGGSLSQEIYLYNETTKLLMKIIETLNRIERKLDEINMKLSTKS